LVVFNNFYLHLLNTKAEIKLYTFEKLAEYYINYIKLIQPQGPYKFFGWSFGGVLAFEIARQLIDNDDKVEIICIDSYFNYKKALSHLKTNTHNLNINNINYAYQPVLDKKKLAQHLKITLFKALDFEGSIQNAEEFKGMDLEQKTSLIDISSYYTYKTKFNHLDDLLEKNSFEVMDINSTHFNWPNNKDILIKICNKIFGMKESSR